MAYRIIQFVHEGYWVTFTANATSFPMNEKGLQEAEARCAELNKDYSPPLFAILKDWG